VKALRPLMIKREGTRSRQQTFRA